MWLYFGESGTSFEFRQFQSAVYDAWGVFALRMLLWGFTLVRPVLEGGVLNY